MAGKLGTAQTTKYQIGTIEVRVGPVTKANGLKQEDSVGLLDDGTIEVTQESVDLLGGFPQFQADTAIISQASSLAATAREYSRKNIQMMLGEGVDAVQPKDSRTTLASSTDDYSLATAEDISGVDGVIAGDLLTIYPEGSPSEISIVKIDTITGTGITLKNETTGVTADDTPMLFDYQAIKDAGTTVHVIASRPVAIGSVQTTKYMSAMMLLQERGTGSPIGYMFWKAAVSAGLTMQSSATDFASFELALKFLEPAASEYEPDGSDLHHIAGIIADHPTGMFWNGGDS